MGREKLEGKGSAVDGAVAEGKGDTDSSVVGGSQNMPGIIPRSDPPSNKGTGGIKTTVGIKNEAMTSGNMEGIKREDYANGNTQTNGAHPPVNGTYANGIPTTPSEIQHQTSTAIENLMGQLPPEIQHITEGYVPFSTLISRLVQETFNGLTDTINDMADIPVSQSGQNGTLNHVNNRPNGNASMDGNVQKKLRILNFANDKRAQFIKILILSRWARQADAVSKVIDLNVWANTRIGEYKNCVSWIGELKRMLIPLRDPNPDIKTALEVLSLGKASWLPDLDYLPHQNLSPHQLLNVLRKINTLLSIRLNIYENIPPVFRDFSIANGRATFRIPEEFEVDLSIAQEEPSSQLYFIDFRFIFSPTPRDLPAGRLRDEIEDRANDILKREGLQGLFDFLHNFVLTHKLAVLKSQAFEMARGHWSDNLLVEAVHRSVVVQYWLSRPGGKNWIEIGLKRGKEVRVASSLGTQRITNIALRWFRNGKEVDDVRVDLKLGDLSLSDILKQIIALHTNHHFQNMAAKLSEAPLYSGAYLRLRSDPATTEPMDASLLVQLTTSKAIKVVQEPVSGRFAVLPASRLNSSSEIELNRLVSPAMDGSSRLSHLRSSVTQEEVNTSARSMGWEPVRYLNLGQEIIQRLFSKGVQRPLFFKKPLWNSSWLLAFTTSLEGDFWWVVELADNEAASRQAIITPTARKSLKAAYKIVLAGQTSLIIEPSSSAMGQVERTAAGMISQNIDSRRLGAIDIPHKIQLCAPKSVKSQSPIATIFMRFPTHRAPSVVRSPEDVTIPWAHEIVKLEYRGLDHSNTSAVQVAHVRMSKSISNIKDVISAIPSIAFRSSSETLIFHIVTKVGETTIDYLLSRLSAIGLLLDFVSTIKSHKIRFNAVSLAHINFSYSKEPQTLKATVHFALDDPKRMSLTPPNPHLRIIDHLTTLLRSQDLSAVIGTMRMTIPILNALSAIETGGVEVLVRSEQWYQIRYSDPFPKVSYDIRLRYRRDDPMWFISDTSLKRPETGDEAFDEGLKAVMRGKGEEWWGCNGGMIAHLHGVEHLVAKLDEVFRSTKHIPEDSNTLKRKAEDDVVEID